MDYAIGIDLGGTHLRAALVDSEGTIFTHRRVPTLAHEGPEAVVGRIAELITAMRESSPDATILGVGVAAPGPLDPEAGIVITAPNMPGWNNFPLRDAVQAHASWPVVIGNDANLAAVGEWRFGGGRGMRNLVYITISTGIGGGVVVDGHPLLGYSGLAAEVGHMVLKHDGPPCGVEGNHGCWESLASGTALAREAAAGLRAGVATALSQLATPETVTTHHIEQAAEAGDAFAAGLIEQAGRWCGIAFVNLLHLYSPQAIFVGGGVSNLGERILGPARAEIAARALPGYRQVPVVPTQLGDHVGLLGAAAQVYHALGAA
ncbi:MAG TPA: ROK family protein [Herpetosiphonaceae bacterium]